MIWPLSLIFKRTPEQELEALRRESEHIAKRFTVLRDNLNAELAKANAKLMQESQKNPVNNSAVSDSKNKVEHIQKALAELTGHQNNELAIVNAKIARIQELHGSQKAA